MMMMMKGYNNTNSVYNRNSHKNIGENMVCDLLISWKFTKIYQKKRGLKLSVNNNSNEGSELAPGADAPTTLSSCEFSG